MQPYNKKGRKTRLMLMPISWAVAFATVYCFMVILSKINGSNIKALLQTETLWPLAVFLPGLMFGKVLGLISINLLGYAAPPFRRIFKAEVSETGRHDFSKAMGSLIKTLVLFGIITLIGAFVFLKFK